ncbi:ribonuclease Z [Candidatus Woesearchaeota archaeon]|nr:ribonuclease Z [Candidatus Woesearchaeota archaeon]
MQLTFLGTSCMVPTKERNVQGIYMSYKAEGILIDCGEGTQRQMNLAGINRNKVNTILVTHWHGDHVGGIIGLLQTISDKDNPPKIEIYGPKGTKKRVRHLLDSVVFDGSNLNLNIFELNPKKVETFKEKDDFYLQCAPMEHSTPCVAYSFVEKDKRKINIAKAKKLGLKEGPSLGKLQNEKSVVVNGKKIFPDDISTIKKGRKLTFIFDTIPTENCYEIAENADLLVTEAVYLPKLRENADKYKHLTTQDAGLIANKANVKKLIVTHFSQRYKSGNEIEEDIKTYFANSETAYDFKKVKF